MKQNITPKYREVKMSPRRALRQLRTRPLRFLVMLMVALIASNVNAQKSQNEDDGPVGIFESRGEYNQFMGGAKRAAYGEGGNPELQAMIPMLNDIALNKPVGWTASEYGVQSSTMGLLANEDVRHEIEMVDQQYEQLQELGKEIQMRAAEQLRSIDFSDRENVASQIQEIRAQATNDLNEVLLPHQLERLQQLRMQSQLRRRSLLEIITSDPLRTELDVSDDQAEDLRKEQELIEADLQKEIAKLRQKAQDRLLSRLKPSQKVEVEKMIGDAFEFKTKEPNWAKRKGQKGKGQTGKGKR